MKVRSLCRMLKEAGMDQETMNFLAKEPKVIEMLVLTAKLERIRRFQDRLPTKKTRR